ncbi:hypothetical protein [Aetokthonos hydrillicola]|jgi:hypothetical protein|nr:hypothetical protein [Aetokthonos hydrillicola]
MKLVDYNRCKYSYVLFSSAKHWLDEYLVDKFYIQISASYIKCLLEHIRLLKKQKWQESQQAIIGILTLLYTTCSPTVSLVSIGY